ncbi:hypothetical protein C8R46DRAFT_1158354 [Mycena filopes]|nr:hypothetical protein C8R46DRAFT_1158354 [Mycena filopes]
MLRDRAMIPLVCRSWHFMACQIVPEYLRITSIPQLRAIVDRFEKAHDTSSPFRGEWVQRIDFRISESLAASPDLIPRLLRCTPNLMIYVNQNGSDYRPETQTPASVLDALGKYCGTSLRRLEWSHVGEAPRWRDLVKLCRIARYLRTLRLTWIFSYQPVLQGLELPSLQTLSLGLIPDPIDTIVELPTSWDPLLNYFAANPESLPLLERFDVEIFPSNLSFFQVHGGKIRNFRTTNWSKPPMLPFVLPLLSNLETLCLTQSTEYVTLPPFHPTLRRICVAPFMDEQIVVPPRFFSSAVLAPLESVLLSIDSTQLPRLEEVRLRNIGILAHLVNEPIWLLKWAKRWHFKGVEFCDMHGRSFGDFTQENDPLLHAVRG